MNKSCLSLIITQLSGYVNNIEGHNLLYKLVALPQKSLIKFQNEQRKKSFTVQFLLTRDLQFTFLIIYRRKKKSMWFNCLHTIFFCVYFKEI